MKITPEKIASLLGASSYANIEEASLPGQQIQEVGTLAACSSLKKLHLQGNRFQVWRQLEGIFYAPKLEYLDLSATPVSRLRKYREYVISHCPNTLQYLDTKRITSEERAKANKEFPNARNELKNLKSTPNSKLSTDKGIDIFGSLSGTKKTKKNDSMSLFGDDSFTVPASSNKYGSSKTSPMTSIFSKGPTKKATESKNIADSLFGSSGGDIFSPLSSSPKKSVEVDDIFSVSSKQEPKVTPAAPMEEEFSDDLDIDVIEVPDDIFGEAETFDDDFDTEDPVEEEQALAEPEKVDETKMSVSTDDVSNVGVEDVVEMPNDVVESIVKIDTSKYDAKFDTEAPIEKKKVSALAGFESELFGSSTKSSLFGDDDDDNFLSTKSKTTTKKQDLFDDSFFSTSSSKKRATKDTSLFGDDFTIDKSPIQQERDVVPSDVAPVATGTDAATDNYISVADRSVDVDISSSPVSEISREPEEFTLNDAATAVDTQNDVDEFVSNETEDVIKPDTQRDTEPPQLQSSDKNQDATGSDDVSEDKDHSGGTTDWMDKMPAAESLEQKSVGKSVSDVQSTPVDDTIAEPCKTLDVENTEVPEPVNEKLSSAVVSSEQISIEDSQELYLEKEITAETLQDTEGHVEVDSERDAERETVDELAVKSPDDEPEKQIETILETEKIENSEDSGVSEDTGDSVDKENGEGKETSEAPKPFVLPPRSKTDESPAPESSVLFGGHRNYQQTIVSSCTRCFYGNGINSRILFTAVDKNISFVIDVNEQEVKFCESDDEYDCCVGCDSLATLMDCFTGSRPFASALLSESMSTDDPIRFIAFLTAFHFTPAPKKLSTVSGTAAIENNETSNETSEEIQEQPSEQELEEARILEENEQKEEIERKRIASEKESWGEWYDMHQVSHNLVLLLVNRFVQCYKAPKLPKYPLHFVLQIKFENSLHCVAVSLLQSEVIVEHCNQSDTGDCIIECSAEALENVLIGKTSISVALMMGHLLPQDGIDNLPFFSEAFDFNIPPGEMTEPKTTNNMLNQSKILTSTQPKPLKQISSDSLLDYQ